MNGRCQTTEYTYDEWLAIFDEAEKSLPNSPTVYRAPNVGSEDFAKKIDHTLLKLDATKEQVDSLCEEARRFNFKVCKILLHQSPCMDTLASLSLYSRQACPFVVETK